MYGVDFLAVGDGENSGNAITDQVTLRFTHGERMFELHAEQAATSTSPHTARELRGLRSEITCSPEEAAALRALLESPAVTDEHGVKWSGRLATESYIDSGPHTLVIEWTERERIVAELVEFQGLSLRPTHYQEDEDDGVVAVTFSATLSEDEMQALWALREGRADQERRYWPVVRRGVSDVPRTMRLGRILWQRNGKSYEHRVTLVDEAEDRQEPGPWLGMRAEPELSHLMAGLADLSGRFDALLDALDAAGILDREARDTIRDAGRTVRRQREYTFYEVDDLSRWQ